MSITKQSTPESVSSDSNSLDFFISQFLNQVWTSTIVRVTSVSNSGNLAGAGEVSIQPLVGQVDSAGKVYPFESPINHVPYFRVQGGSDAIILDPKEGDIGVAIFANRDVTVAKSTKAPSPPGSARKFHISDAFYLGGYLNGVPSQYIRFSQSGIEMVSPTKVTMSAPTVELDAPSIILNGAVTQGSGSNSGTATFANGATTPQDFSAGTISLKGHKHSGIQTGSGNSGAPVP